MPNNLIRYKDVLPYKNNTISVSTPNQQINASWIHLPTENSFIATQGPKPNTIIDFWSMCFEYNINKIIMLCKENEDGKVKCSKYWEINDDNFKIINIDTNVENKGFIKRIINIKNLKDGTDKKITQIQYTEWPDKTIPELSNIVNSFEFLFKFIDDSDMKNPVLIHCSAGIGRTGVFIACYILYKEIMGIIMSSQDLIIFSIFNLVRKLKELRMFLVENLTQYEFIYKFIGELLKEKNI